MESNFEPPIGGNQQNSSNKSNFPVWTILVLVIVLVIIWIFWGGVENKQTSQENVQVTKVDMATNTGRDKLPEGFPEEIPVEIEGVVESYTATHSDSKVTVHTVSYRTSRDQRSVFEEYLTFVSYRGFQIYTMSDKPDTKSLYARKGNIDFSFDISPVGTQSLVHLSYLVRN